MNTEMKWGLLKRQTASTAMFYFHSAKVVSWTAQADLTKSMHDGGKFWKVDTYGWQLTRKATKWCVFIHKNVQMNLIGRRQFAFISQPHLENNPRITFW